MSGALCCWRQEKKRIKPEADRGRKRKKFPGHPGGGLFYDRSADEAGSKEMISLLPEQPLLIFHIQEGEETVYWFGKTSIRS